MKIIYTYIGSFTLIKSILITFFFELSLSLMVCKSQNSQHIYQRTELIARRKQTPDSAFVGNIIKTIIDLDGKNQIDSVLMISQRSLELNIESHHQLYTIYTVIGRVYLKKGQLKKAEESLGKAISLNEQYKMNKSSAYADIQYVYTHQGNLKEAIKYAITAYKIDVKNNDTLNIMKSLYDLGRLNRNLRRWNESLRYFEKAIKLAEKKNSNNVISACYQGIGNVYFDTKDYKKSINFYKKSIDAQKNAEIWYGMAYIYRNIGMGYQKLTQYTLARKYYKSSEKLLTKFSDMNELVMLWGAQSDLEISIGNYNEAKIYCEKILNFSQKNKFTKGESVAYELLSKMYETKGDYKQGLYYHKKYKILVDSLLNIESEKVNQELLAKYELSEKENQIEKQKVVLLSNEIKLKAYQMYTMLAGLIIMGIILYILLRYQKIQKQQTDALRELLNLKGKLVEEESFNYIVSHELKQHLSDIERHFHNSVSTNRPGEAIKLAKQITDLNILIDKLLNLSKYEVSTIFNVQFSVKELIKEILEEKSVSNKVNIEIVNLPELKADRFLIKEVFVNLIDNAIKYSSKQENPYIKIEGKEQNNNWVFTIEDNGIGFTEESAQMLFLPFQRLSQDSIFNGSGIGLFVVKKIIEKYNGRIWAMGRINEGATFSFTLPSSLIFVR